MRQGPCQPQRFFTGPFPAFGSISFGQKVFHAFDDCVHFVEQFPLRHSEIAQNAQMGSWTHEFQDGRIKLRYPFLHNRQPRTYDPRSRVIAWYMGKCIAANMRVPCQMDGSIFTFHSWHTYSNSVRASTRPLAALRPSISTRSSHVPAAALRSCSRLLSLR